MSSDVSVILPVYNAMADGGAMLRAAVGSVLSQNGVELELIIVDDASTDGTADFAAGLIAADGRARLLRLPANLGLSGARNAGLESAAGRYVAYVDADDMLLPGALHALVRAAEDSGLAVVIGGWTRREPRGEGVRGTGALSVYDAPDYIESTLYQRGGHNSAWAKIARTDLMRRLPFRQGWYYEDLLMMPRLYLAAGRIGVIDRQVYYYRENAASFLNRWSESRLDAVRVCEDNAAYIAEHLPRLLPAANDRLMSAAFNIYILAARNGRRDVCDRCWQIIKTHRLQSLLNPRVRLKNRLGALLSYAGRRVLGRIRD